MVLFKVLVDQRKVSALILLMQRQRIVLVCFTTCMLARQKSISLRQIKKSQLSESILSEKSI